MRETDPSSIPGGPRELLPIPPGAKTIQDVIVRSLKIAAGQTAGPVTGEPFLQAWKEICTLVDLYQHEIITHSRHQKTCTKGCSFCCNHWVDEVYSFEAEIIAEDLRKNHADKLSRIIDVCAEDIAVYNQLGGLVAARTQGDEERNVDERDLLLSVFYQMERPCPLREKGACIVYDVRPLTCRNYVSFADPEDCRPELINEGRSGTYLFSVEDESLELLMALHKRYVRVRDEFGLRPLLLKLLSE